MQVHMASTHERGLKYEEGQPERKDCGMKIEEGRPGNGGMDQVLVYREAEAKDHHSEDEERHPEIKESVQCAGAAGGHIRGVPREWSCSLTEMVHQPGPAARTVDR